MYGLESAQREKGKYAWVNSAKTFVSSRWWFELILEGCRRRFCLNFSGRGTSDRRSRVRADGTKEFEIGQGVAGSLEEKHRLFDLRQVFGTFGAGLFWRV